MARAIGVEKVFVTSDDSGIRRQPSGLTEPLESERRKDVATACKDDARGARALQCLAKRAVQHCARSRAACRDRLRRPHYTTLVAILDPNGQRLSAQLRLSYGRHACEAVNSRLGGDGGFDVGQVIGPPICARILWMDETRRDATE
jgi:hypothetical protein